MESSVWVFQETCCCFVLSAGALVCDGRSLMPCALKPCIQTVPSAWPLSSSSSSSLLPCLPSSPSSSICFQVLHGLTPPRVIVGSAIKAGVHMKLDLVTDDSTPSYNPSLVAVPPGQVVDSRQPTADSQQEREIRNILCLIALTPKVLAWGRGGRARQATRDASSFSTPPPILPFSSCVPPLPLSPPCCRFQPVKRSTILGCLPVDQILERQDWSGNQFGPVAQ